MREENGSFLRRACGWESHTPFHVSIPCLDLGRMSTFPCLRRLHIMTKAAASVCLGFVLTPRASYPLTGYAVYDCLVSKIDCIRLFMGAVPGPALIYPMYSPVHVG